jgi:hypothetical protein
MKMLLWQTYIAGNITKCLGLNVRCPIFLPDFNQIYIFSTVSLQTPVRFFFFENPVGFALINADGREINRRFSQLCERS